MKTFFLFCSILCLAQECNWNYGVPGSVNQVKGGSLPLERRALRPEIVGGGKADENEYGWQVQMSMGCGGTLIGREWILTAAHCFTSPNDDFTIELAHQTYLRSTATKVKVFIHPQFDSNTLDNDIALVQIQPLSCDLINDGVQAIGLAANDEYGGFTIDGCTAFITGTGYTDEQQTPTIFGSLFEISSTVHNKQWCNSRGFKNMVRIDDRAVCAWSEDEQREDACQGDSGGPLKIDIDISTTQHIYVQLGIVSWGIGCGKYPGVYTNIASFNAWIKSVYPSAHFVTISQCDTAQYEEGYDYTWIIISGSILGCCFCGILGWCGWNYTNNK